MPASHKLPQCLVQLASELPPTLGSEEVARLLQCTDRHLRRLVVSGELSAFRRVNKGSSRLIFARGEVLRFLAAHPA